MSKTFLTAVFSLACLFATLGLRTIENTDYLRYAEVAREMVETGDWVVPRENGEIYTNKPPLHFWNIALAYKALGVTPFAARLPSAVFAFVLLAAVMLFTRKVSGSREAGTLAALFMLSCYVFFFFAHRTRIDLEYAALFTGSLMCFYAGAVNPRQRYLFFSLFWLCTGLGFMDKGPAVLLNLVIAIAFVIAERKQRRTAFGMAPLLITLPLAAVPVAPWIYKLSRHPEFSLYWEIFKSTRSMTRHEGLFYYIPQLVSKCAPIILFLPVACKALKGECAEKAVARLPVRFLAVWCAAYFILLNLTTAKNHRYLLPMLAPLSILTGWGTLLAVRNGLCKKYLETTSRFVFRAAAAVLIAAPAAAWKIHGQFKPFLAVSLAMLVGLFWLKRNGAHRVTLMLVCIPLLYTYVDFFAAANNEKTSPAQTIWQVIGKQGIAPQDTLFYKDCGRLRETLSFYANRLIDCSDDARKARQYKAVVMDAENTAGFDAHGCEEIIVTTNKKKDKMAYVYIRKAPEQP